MTARHGFGLAMKSAGVVLSLLTLAAIAHAEEIGTVAAADGTVEIVRGGTSIPAAVGTAVQLGDELRTGQPGRLRIVFQDDSVLALSDASRVVITTQVFDINKGKAHSLMDLIRGKVTAVVSDYYHQPGANYEIKTATAVAGVRGTEFSVAYYDEQDLTEVVGVHGTVTVHSLVDPTGPGVLVTANESTIIVKGDKPSEPQRLQDRIFRQRLEGFDFIGGGRVESQALSQATGVGATVTKGDRASTTVAPPSVLPPPLKERRDASSLVGQSPPVVAATTGQFGIVVGTH